MTIKVSYRERMILAWCLQHVTPSISQGFAYDEIVALLRKLGTPVATNDQKGNQ